MKNLAFHADEFARSLAKWFGSAQRDLSWRRAHNASDAYRILVSEVMLQQTTVAAVGPFYERFLTRFPTVQSLAEAPESDVLAQWSGLGYYARARNLQKAAQAVVARHEGKFPRDLEALLALPGVGRYTAGAVASIAFNMRAPIVDANVARVLSRVLGIEGDLKTTANANKLWEGAQKIVQVAEVEPREINPAMMELGALICTPKNPRCAVCPVSQWCYAKRENKQNELPYIPPKKAPTEIQDICALAINEAGQILLRLRPDNARWWALMWELPRTTVAEDETGETALQRLADELGIFWRSEKRLGEVKHGVTRFAITLQVQRVYVEQLEESQVLKWVSPELARDLAMPSVMRKLVEKYTVNAPSEQLRLPSF